MLLGWAVFFFSALVWSAHTCFANGIRALTSVCRCNATRLSVFGDGDGGPAKQPAVKALDVVLSFDAADYLVAEEMTLAMQFAGLTVYDHITLPIPNPLSTPPELRCLMPDARCPMPDARWLLAVGC
jgi:hypothetical protein